MTSLPHIIYPDPFVIQNTVEVFGVKEAAKLLNNHRQQIPFGYFHQCVLGVPPRTIPLASVYIQGNAEAHAEYRQWEVMHMRGLITTDCLDRQRKRIGIGKILLGRLQYLTDKERA